MRMASVSRYCRVVLVSKKSVSDTSGRIWGWLQSIESSSWVELSKSVSYMSDRLYGWLQSIESKAVVGTGSVSQWVSEWSVTLQPRASLSADACIRHNHYLPYPQLSRSFHEALHYSTLTHLHPRSTTTRPDYPTNNFSSSCPLKFLSFSSLNVTGFAVLSLK